MNQSADKMVEKFKLRRSANELVWAYKIYCCNDVALLKRFYRSTRQLVNRLSGVQLLYVRQRRTIDHKRPWSELNNIAQSH